MFGIHDKPPRPRLKPRPHPKIVDVFGNLPNSFGHIARDPNTSYQINLDQYKREASDLHDELVEKEKKNRQRARVEEESLRNFEKKSYLNVLNNKVNKKLEEGNKNLEKRREKLRNLFWQEEREYLREIVDISQKSKQLRIEEKLEHISAVINQNEAETEAMIKTKRMQQYLARCAEFRPLITKQRSLEAKEVNLIQMKEKESKKQSEKELDYLWYKLNEKYCKRKDEREDEERLKREKQINEFKYYATLQAKEKLTKERKMRQEMLEEQKRLDQLRRDIEEQNKIEMELKRKKHKETCDLFASQLKERRESLQRTTDKEQNIQRNYDKLAAEEYAKEQAAIKAKISTAHEDIIKFKNYLANFRKEKEEEVRRMKEITDGTMKSIQQQYDDAKCEEETKRKILLQTVLKERAEQIEFKKAKKEEMEKALRKEQELSKQAQKLNQKLRFEYEQQNKLKVQKYREDLDQQISYRKMLEEREKEKEKKILEASVLENEKYDKIVADVLSGDVKISETHIFRKIINEQKCFCLKPNY